MGIPITATPARRRRPSPRSRRRRRRRRSVLRRFAPLIALCAAAFGAGLLVGAGVENERLDLAREYVDAWQERDYAAMYRMLAPPARATISAEGFELAHREALLTATARAFRVERPAEESDGVVLVPMRVRTRVFGDVGGDVALPVVEQVGGTYGVAWEPNMTFPGVARGERLSRRTRIPPRADILARDGTPLAAGPDRTSEVTGSADIVGELGSIPADRRTLYRAAGYPDDAQVGTTGIELELQQRVAGRPGGVLLAGDRVIARAAPRAAPPVRSTISPPVQEAAVNALGGRFGGAIALTPRGEILGVAGAAYSALAPPGSTFKIITTVAALESRKVSPSDSFDVQTSANIEGYVLSNAHGEACGGTFEETFAHSCNSVYAPLGVEVGAEKLVETSEKFGFNNQPPLAGASTSLIPEAAEIGSDLDVGVSAIGQGKVQSTTLQMAQAGQVIAARGLLYPPTYELGRRTRPVRVTTPAIAEIIRSVMVAVVEYGTGEAAQISGVKVSGKTGTAELGEGITEDAWFVGFAPSETPEIVGAAWVSRAGAGGSVAAPIVQPILSAGLDAGV